MEATITALALPSHNGGDGAELQPRGIAHDRHRLRDLGRGQRWVAVAFAAVLLLAPLLALAKTLPDWAPANDPALMALRTLDVGTSRTPVSGQPSQSVQYVGDVPTVTHLGPTHFYLMAIPVRVLGAATGMLVVSVAITGSCLVLSAWAVFRQLGPRAAVLAALALAAITFANGTAALVNPISSNIAGYPLFCSMVLLWCLLCGDLRLLVLTTAMLSFTVQQHLSVGPSIAVAMILVGALLVWRARRPLRQADRRREMLRWAGWSVVVGTLMWSPVLVQQFFGDRGNLTTLWEYTTHDDRPTLGLDSAIRQVAHVVGWPSVLSQDDLNGYWLWSPPSAVTWISAVAVLGLAAAAGLWRWRSDRRRGGLAEMVGVLVVAGLVNGSSVPEGVEAPRPAFYHWVWPLTFFVLLVLGLTALQVVDRAHLRLPRPRLWTSAALSLSLLAMVAASVVAVRTDRFSNTLRAVNAPLEQREVDELADEILLHRDTLGAQTVVLERGSRSFEWLDAALALELVERGVDARLWAWFGQNQFVHADRVADRSTLDSGLVMVLTKDLADADIEVPGELVATVSSTGLPADAFEELVAQARAADEVVLGEAAEAKLADSDGFEPFLRDRLRDLTEQPEDLLVESWVVDLLLEAGLEQPRLDPTLLRQVAAYLDDPEGHGYRIQVYLLNREQILDYATPIDVGA